MSTQKHDINVQYLYNIRFSKIFNCNGFFMQLTRPGFNKCSLSCLQSSKYLLFYFTWWIREIRFMLSNNNVADEKNTYWGKFLCSSSKLKYSRMGRCKNNLVWIHWSYISLSSKIGLIGGRKVCSNKFFFCWLATKSTPPLNCGFLLSSKTYNAIMLQ